MKSTSTNKRIFMKCFSYRVVSIFVTILLVWAVTGSTKGALSIGVLDFSRISTRTCDVFHIIPCRCNFQVHLLYAVDREVLIGRPGRRSFPGLTVGWQI